MENKKIKEIIPGFLYELPGSLFSLEEMYGHLKKEDKKELE